MRVIRLDVGSPRFALKYLVAVKKQKCDLREKKKKIQANLQVVAISFFHFFCAFCCVSFFVCVPFLFRDDEYVRTQEVCVGVEEKGRQRIPRRDRSNFLT